MKIKGIEIGRTHKVYTIAEIGKNHNGHISIAKELIKTAHHAGCNAVKFQAYHTEHLLHTYSKSGAEPETEWLKKCELQPIDFIRLRQLCDSIGITFLCTPESDQWVDVLAHRVHVPAFKISSLNINNYRMLYKIRSKKLPVILSTGMSYQKEVASAVDILGDDIALLHCVSQYPARVDSLNLKVMDSMRRQFGVPVGFSDHTVGGVGAKLAACAGAEILEFHITLDNSMRGPDHKFSLNPEQLKKMTIALWEIQKALGDGVKRPHVSEGSYVWMKRRCCVAANTIQRGKILQARDIICLAPGVEGAMPASDIYKLTGGSYVANVEIPKGRPIFVDEVRRG